VSVLALFAAVLLDVRLCRLGRMMRGVLVMAARGVSVVRRLLMRTRIVMLCGFAMMLRSLFMVVCSLSMIGSCFLRHGVLLD
jgi:hypothetical protein